MGTAQPESAASRLTVRLEPDDLEWLRQEAKRRGRFAAVSDVVRDLIRQARAPAGMPSLANTPPDEPDTTPYVQQTRAAQARRGRKA